MEGLLLFIRLENQESDHKRLVIDSHPASKVTAQEQGCRPFPSARQKFHDGNGALLYHSCVV